jgi:predicted CoA-binding protein
VQDVRPPVEGALLLTNPAATEQVVRDCSEAAIKMVWMFRGGGAGAVSSEAIVFCRMNGIRVVSGECPFMFFPETGLVHRVHGWLLRLVGRYPC